MTVEGEDEDIFIPESQVNGAFHGDTVQVALTRAERHGRRREGQITKILTRGVSRDLVCTYEKSKTLRVCSAGQSEIWTGYFYPAGALQRGGERTQGRGGTDGLTAADGRKPEGKVVEILGHVNDPGTDILSIVTWL